MSAAFSITEKLPENAPEWLAGFVEVTWNGVTGLLQIDAPNLAAARLSVLPPEEADLDTARHRYRSAFCARRGLDVEVCDRASSAAYDPPRHVLAAREVWCGERGYPLKGGPSCADVFARMDSAFDAEWETYRTALIAAIPKPDLSGRDLRRADLSHSELSGVDLQGAQLDGAVLHETRLEGAILREARVRGVNLTGALLEGADLREASLDWADLIEAQLTGADLVLADLVGADLTLARLEEADLTWASMDGADLGGARMEGASLYGARLEGANFAFSTMFGTADRPMILDPADLTKATTAAAALRFVQLRPSTTDLAARLRNSFGDATATLPGGVEPPCQWAAEPLSDAEFFARRGGWVEVTSTRRWSAIAPEQWRDVEPAPPPAGCGWKE